MKNIRLLHFTDVYLPIRDHVSQQKFAKEMKTTQRKMKRNLRVALLRDKIRNRETRRRSKVRDIVEKVAKMDDGLATQPDNMNTDGPEESQNIDDIRTEAAISG